MCKRLKFQSPSDSSFNSLIHVTVSWKLLYCYTAQEAFFSRISFQMFGGPHGQQVAAMPASQTFKGTCHPMGGEVGSSDTELRVPVALKSAKATTKTQWRIPVFVAAL